MNNKTPKFKCFKCEKELSKEEIYYYGHSCDACEAKTLEAYEIERQQHRAIGGGNK